MFSKRSLPRRREVVGTGAQEAAAIVRSDRFDALNLRATGFGLMRGGDLARVAPVELALVAAPHIGRIERTARGQRHCTAAVEPQHRIGYRPARAVRALDEMPDVRA